MGLQRILDGTPDLNRMQLKRQAVTSRTGSAQPALNSFSLSDTRSRSFKALASEYSSAA